MGSIPLPALATRPPEQQPGPMDTYARALQIKGAQQQLQAGAQETQMRAMQLHDQQAMTAAMQEWDGKDYNALPGLVLKNKGSAQAVLSLRSNIVKQQQELANLSKDQLANEKTKNDYFAQQLDNIKQLPPEQQGQAFEAAKADAVQRGHLDPQMAQQLQYQGPQQLDVLEKNLLGYSGALAAAEKQQTMANQKAAEQRAVEEFNAKKQKGLLGGQPSVPLMQMNDWLAKNPGKGPSDYEVAMKKVVPAFNFNLNQAAGGKLQDAALDQAAERYWQTGQLPPTGRGAAGIVMARNVMNRAAELHPQGSIAANSAEYKANAESLRNLQKSRDAIGAFEQTAGKNLDNFIAQAQKVVDTGSPLLNTPLRMMSEKILGSPQMSAYKSARQVAVNEIAKITSNPNLSGVLSDEARREISSFSPDNATLQQTLAVARVLRQDMANRPEALDNQIRDIKGRIGQAQQGGANGSHPFFNTLGGTVVK